MNRSNYFVYQVLANNPVLVGTVGLCPVVAVCSSLKAALIMSGITIASLVVAQLLTSLFLKHLPQWVRLGLYTLVSMCVVIPCMIFVDKYSPETMLALGIFLPLLAVNPLIVRNCEREAIEGGVGESLVSSVCAGIGYSLVLIIVGLVREIIGAGSVWGVKIPFIMPARSFMMPIGGFIILSYLAAALRVYFRKVDPEFADELILNSRTNIKGSKKVRLQLRGAKAPNDVFVPSVKDSIVIEQKPQKTRLGRRKKGSGKPPIEVMTLEQAEELRAGAKPSMESTVQAEFAPLTYDDVLTQVQQTSQDTKVYVQEDDLPPFTYPRTEESQLQPETVQQPQARQTSRFDFVTLDLVSEAKATNEYERYLEAIARYDKDARREIGRK